jgi:two-component system sensor histidine kinase ComP
MEKKEMPKFRKDIIFNNARLVRKSPIFLGLLLFCSLEVLICALIFGERLTIKDYLLMELTLTGVSLFFLFRFGRNQAFNVLRKSEAIENNYMETFSSAISNAQTLKDIDSIFLKEMEHLIPYQEIAVVEFDLITNQAVIRAGVNTDEQLSGWLRFEVQTYDFIDLKQKSFYQIYHSSCKAIFLIINKKKQPFFVASASKIRMKTMKAFISIAYEKQFLVEGLMKEINDVLSKNPRISSKMIRLIFELSEQERSKLSLEIHDTALQEQLLWHRRLQELFVYYEIDSPIRASLSEVSEGMLDVIYRIREVCTDLRPQIVWERGIVGALNDLFKKVQLRSDFMIEFEASHFHFHLNQEEIITLYRIVQELLNNADKHAKAKNVSFTLFSMENLAVLTYTDDGIGMKIQTDEQERKGMGIAGIRERVRGLAGMVEFGSEPHRGVQFEMSFEPYAKEPFTDG